MLSKTPETVAIKPRNLKFDVEAEIGADWNNNDAFVTAFFNSMSILFPIGEKMFIDSVREHKSQVSDPKLLQEMSGFFGQEGFHRREHQRFNEQLCEHRNYELERLEKHISRGKKLSDEHLTPLQRLAATVAAEHFTGSFADLALTQGRWFGNASPAMKQLWLWHAAEELEHKAVAFDVFKAVGGDEKTRAKAMRQTMFFLTFDIMRGAVHMLRKDKQLWKLNTWKQAYKFLFAKNTGFFPAIRPYYKDFFREDFHPWDQDNQELLVQWQDTAILPS